MNLQKVFEEAQSEIDEQKQKLAKKEADLQRKSDSLDEKASNLDDLEKQLEDKANELQERESKIAGVENTQDELKRLSELRVANVESFNQARKQESRLVEVKMALDQREASVVAREQAVSEREETYKEKLKKDFLEELQKKIG